MALLNQSLQKQLHDIFVGLPRPVTLLSFVKMDEQGVLCATCEDTRALAEELASISDGKIRVEVYDINAHAAEAQRYRVDKAPAVVVLGDDSGRRDFGIRFFGSPAGYEFATLIEDIRMASTGTTDLADGTLEALARLTSPLHLQVFVTPTCPYCPRAALLAHKMAMASEWVTADAVDATEFPALARRYQVYGVPRTVINETVHIEGAVPEAALMARLTRLLSAEAPSPA